jgi:O-antigen ligase
VTITALATSIVTRSVEGVGCTGSAAVGLADALGLVFCAVAADRSARFDLKVTTTAAAITAMIATAITKLRIELLLLPFVSGVLLFAMRFLESIEVVARKLRTKTIAKAPTSKQ